MKIPDYIAIGVLVVLADGIANASADIITEAPVKVGASAGAPGLATAQSAQRRRGFSFVSLLFRFRLSFYQSSQAVGAPFAIIAMQIALTSTAVIT